MVSADASAPATSSDAARLRSLVEQLGDPDYWRRDAAMRELERLGGNAIDELLEAAEQSGDLEISLRARWLMHTIPLVRPQDPPTVTQLLDGYRTADLRQRVSIMHRLLRLEDDTGIEPLARLLRLEQSPMASRVAAALLVREWSPDDPFFQPLVAPIRAGVGPSRRASVRMLNAVSDVATGRMEAIEELLAASDDLRKGPVDVTGDSMPPVESGESSSELSNGLAESTGRIFDRCRILALSAVGRQEQALEEAAALLAAARAGKKIDEAVAFLAWCTDHGLAAVADTVERRPNATVDDHRLLTFAAAVADRAAGQPVRGEKAAAAAGQLPAAGPMDRTQTASMLAKWGAVDWASREFSSILGDPRTDTVEFVYASILFSEFLHDQSREAEAATALAGIFRPPARADIDADGILRQLDRDPRMTRSRMLFFEACAASDGGDAATQRQKLEEAVRTWPKDVDALISLHGLAEATPTQRQAVARQIRAALEQIDNEIAAMPDEPNGYNEYAWLVANTVDASTVAVELAKATRYSRRSLEISFDNASYLDTLAHCHAAEGRHDRAVRTQLLAMRYEPHNRTIRRNFEGFRAAAASAPAEGSP